MSKGYYGDGMGIVWMAAAIIFVFLFVLLYLPAFTSVVPLRCIDANSSAYYSQEQQNTIDALNKQVSELKDEKSVLEKMQPANYSSALFSVAFFGFLGILIWDNRRANDQNLRKREIDLREKELEKKGKKGEKKNVLQNNS